MEKYNFKTVEKKWQDIWEKEETFKSITGEDKPKYYPLVEFPYPSGQGLHVGHPRSYTALDIIARKKRLEGFNVLYAIGWDAFGLPTENFAIKSKIHPRIVTKNNIANFKRQLKSLGLSFDWSREINTTDPDYYKWTQWIFLKFFENNLAYKKKMPINWCPSCKTGLANEEVKEGKCERCATPVEIRDKSEWMLKITAYADKLLDGLKDVDFIDRVKTSQINWIGKSIGYDVDFVIPCISEALTIFTTRVDTIFGATYMVISPGNPVIEKLKKYIQNMDEVQKYIDEAKQKTEFQRGEYDKEKTGIRLIGVNAVNPLTEKEIPVFLSDYVLMSYGTGAVMGVPAHDERDHEFAVKFGLPIIEVVSGGQDVSKQAYTDVAHGKLVNSGKYSGLDVKEAIDKIGEDLEKAGKAEKKTNYKLRDWVFSRQRYWGEPIPLIYCEDCGWVAVPEDQLPLELPEIDDYEPTDDGNSPLAKAADWVETTCPKCGKKARRETDTMPQWAGSSWYYLRYADPNNDKAFASKEALKYWMPVDWYNGGMEHTTLHLLYSRFWHKFLYDLGLVDTPEPYMKRTSHGMILGEDNQKMSKSRGNVINPDEIVDNWGADTFRLYEMFLGDFEKKAPWSSENIKGCYRFLERIWRMFDMTTDENSDEKIIKSLHKTIKKVSYDYDNLKANTAIAQMMTFLNDVYDVGKINKEDFKTFLILLNPVVPHITEELWAMTGEKDQIAHTSWPSYEEKYTIEDMINMPISINGKTKTVIQMSAGISQEQAVKIADELDIVKKAKANKTVKKIVFVQNKILNYVII